jgi:hypothetical protein
MKVFENIYKNNGWGGQGSGPGSLPEVTKTYRKFIEKFIEKYKIKTIVDFGCGDWQFSKFINWSDADYLGYDVVESLIKHHSSTFEANNIKFAITPKEWNNLKNADLLLVKDVLQHLDNQSVVRFMNIAQNKYKYMLVANCTKPQDRLNLDIQTGDFRPLDIRKQPFNFNAKRVLHFIGPRKNIYKLNFQPSWEKNVLLIYGKNINN